MEEKYTVTRLAHGRYVGVAEASKGLGVRKQTIYMVLSGWTQAMSEEKRNRLIIVDRGGRHGKQRR